MRLARPMPECAMSPSPPISLEVSTMTTRLLCPTDSRRAISRITVVFPTPGRPCRCPWQSGCSAPAAGANLPRSPSVQLSSFQAVLKVAVGIAGWHAKRDSASSLATLRRSGPPPEDNEFPLGYSTHHKEYRTARCYEVSRHRCAAQHSPTCPARQAHDAAVAVAHAGDAVQRAVYPCPVVVSKISQLQQARHSSAC